VNNGVHRPAPSIVFQRPPSQKVESYITPRESTKKKKEKEKPELRKSPTKPQEVSKEMEMK
jgi:hypothetical protein